MTVSSHNQTLITEGNQSTADVLLVRISPAAITSLPVESFSQAESGCEALGMLRLLRFHLLVASLDVPDMRPWELFLKARRAQARLQCVLIDERMTLEDEQHVRQAGASAFPSTDPAICAALVGSSPRIVRATAGAGGKRFIPAQQQPGPAPP
jgi:DNA-binding NarL/FixJ family response regulator